MGTDYYPRLAGIAHDNRKATTMINQQAEIAVLILSPILCVFLVFINWVVILLYSTKFVAINGMIHWAALGMFFKAISWPIGYVFLAKGASKTFFLSELAANLYMLILNLCGYHFWGLNGLGISFLISFILVFIQVFLIAKIKYNFCFNRVFVKIFLIQILFGILCFVSVKYFNQLYSSIIGTIIILLSIIYSIIELNSRIDFKQLFFRFKN
jgi:O-antigen/teichoic acid export membrane protein